MIAERSDWNVLLDNRRFALTERVPEPLSMTDTEILDWMNEYSWRLEEEDGRWHFDSGFDSHVTGRSIREVVCKAAALFQEANE